MSGFHWSDYLVYSVALLVSLGIGVYHAIAKGGQNTTEQYLLGGRKMSFLPVTISLVSRIRSLIVISINPKEVETNEEFHIQSIHAPRIKSIDFKQT